jgi:hypothetical protein
MGETDMNKRRHQRMEVDNLMVDISDGRGFFTGTVCDLSRFGLMVDNIPKKLDEKAPHLSVVISGQGKHFKMKVRPRWFVRQSVGKKIGVELLNAPWGWTEFVMNLEPKDDDVWGTINL